MKLVFAYYRIPNLGVHNISSVKLTTNQMVLLAKRFKVIPTLNPRLNSIFTTDFDAWARRAEYITCFQMIEKT
jgi:hypothetical protein